MLTVQTRQHFTSENTPITAPDNIFVNGKDQYWRRAMTFWPKRDSLNTKILYM